MNRKNIIVVLIAAFVVAATGANAQIKLGTPAGAPNSGAILDASNTGATATTYKGVYLPQVALTGNNVYGLNTGGSAVAVNGMMIYNTATAGTGITAVTPGIYIWNSNVWNKVNTSSANGNDKNIYEGNGTLTGNRTVSQAGFNLGFMGGSVGIGTTTPSGLLANNSSNPGGSDGNGVASDAINWQTPNNGYVAALFNSSTAASANGLEVKVANNSATSNALDVSTGTALGAGAPLFVVKGTGNTGVGVAAPTNRLHVVAATNPVRFVGMQQSASTTTGTLVTDNNGVILVKNANSVSAVRATGTIKFSVNNTSYFNDVTTPPAVTVDNLGEFSGHTFTPVQPGLYSVTFQVSYDQRASTNDDGDGYMGYSFIIEPSATGTDPTIISAANKISLPEANSQVGIVVVSVSDLVKLTAGQVIQFTSNVYGSTGGNTASYVINILRVD